MQSTLNTALPEHFRRPQFTFHLGPLSARQSCKRARCGEPDLGDRICTLKTPTEMLWGDLEEYLSKPQGLLDQQAEQTCDEINTDIVKLFAEVEYDEEFLLPLMLDLSRLQRFTALLELIPLESQQTLNHILLVFAQKEDLPSGMPFEFDQKFWGSGFSSIRQTVSTGGQHTGVIGSTPGRIEPYYLPCHSTWWTSFLLRATWLWSSNSDVGPVWSTMHGAAHVARAFLKAGASIEVELCLGYGGKCHGYVCVCPDPYTHSRLYECPESSTDQSKKEDKHKHKWISAKSILSERLGIPESELLQTEARNRNTQSRSTADLLDLARDTEAAWQRYVEACFCNKIPIVDEYGNYSEFPKVVIQVEQSGSQVA